MDMDGFYDTVDLEKTLQAGLTLEFPRPLLELSVRWGRCCQRGGVAGAQPHPRVSLGTGDQQIDPLWTLMHCQHTSQLSDHIDLWLDDISVAVHHAKAVVAASSGPQGR